MKRSYAIAPLIALGLAACADNTAPLQITPDDQRQAAVISSTDATAEDMSIMYASDLSLSGGAVTSASTGGAEFMRVPSEAAAFTEWSFAASCPFSSTTSRFVCAPLTSAGLTLNRDYAFADASGAAQDAYNASTTASVNFHVNVAGVHTAPAGADTVSRDRNVTVSGLSGAETSRTWNGTGTRNDGGYRTDGDVTRRYHISDDATFANIVVTLPRSSHPWPASGTITRHVDGTGSVARGGGEKSFAITKTVIITFNGTQYAAVTVDGVAYTLDMLNGTVTKN